MKLQAVDLDTCRIFTRENDYSMADTRLPHSPWVVLKCKSCRVRSLDELRLAQYPADMVQEPHLIIAGRSATRVVEPPTGGFQLEGRRRYPEVLRMWTRRARIWKCPCGVESRCTARRLLQRLSEAGPGGTIYV